MPEFTPETDPDREHFQWFVSGAYRRVDADSIWRALMYLVRHRLHADNPTIMLMFVRAAETYPDVTEFLKAQRPTANEAEQAALKLTLDPPDEIREGGYLPDQIQSPGEMDLCWGDFLVTGHTGAIDKVVAVLDREDQTRGFINGLLVSAPSTGTADSTPFELTDPERLELASIGVTLGHSADEGPDVILSEGDVDLLVWFGYRAKNATCIRMFQLMNDELKLHVASKGAAVWSLQANAKQHGKIRLFCDEHAKQAGGFGRTLLA